MSVVALLRVGICRFGCLAILGLCSGSGGLPRPSEAAGPDHAVAGEMARLIDDALQESWRRQGQAPASTAPPATLLRRVSLDLIGRIPTVSETRSFLADASPQRFTKRVGQLLRSPAHARHLATVLRRSWIPAADTPQFAHLVEPYEAWLTRRLKQGACYDELVREQLTVPVCEQAVPVDSDQPTLGSPAFLAAADVNPARLAANTTRAFLGLNLDCAQCHDHPFSRWRREEFWQVAAFFSHPAPSTSGQVEPWTIEIEETGRVVRATYPEGEPLEVPRSRDAQAGPEALARWITAEKNPYFARNAVNRLWATCFGSGLVEPLDDLSGAEPSPQNALLNALAARFARDGYRLQPLVEGMVRSRAYRASARASAPRETPPPSASLPFHKMPVRALTGEQLHASLLTAAGMDPTSVEPQDRQAFVARFFIDRPTEAERSLSQALVLMNGELTNELTNPQQSPLLITLQTAPFLGLDEKIELLFLASYTRHPTPVEVVETEAYVRTHPDPSQAWANVFWAFLNSTEFNTNH